MGLKKVFRVPSTKDEVDARRCSGWLTWIACHLTDSPTCSLGKRSVKSNNSGHPSYLGTEELILSLRMAACVGFLNSIHHQNLLTHERKS